LLQRGLLERIGSLGLDGDLELDVAWDAYSRVVGCDHPHAMAPISTVRDAIRVAEAVAGRVVNLPPN
jgi:hypothetical protein